MYDKLLKHKWYTNRKYLFTTIRKRLYYAHWLVAGKPKKPFKLVPASIKSALSWSVLPERVGVASQNKGEAIQHHSNKAHRTSIKE